MLFQSIILTITSLLKIC